MDSLVDLITEMVMKELEASSPGAAEGLVSRPSAAPAVRSGPRLLIVPGPEPVGAEVWAAVVSAKVRPSALVWTGFRQDQLPVTTAGWSLEARAAGWGKVVADYAGVVLFGSDLPSLGSIASLGGNGLPGAGVAVAAVAAGLPVFCESTVYEGIRRHSARLAPGFVQAFENSWRIASSFGIEFGGVAELGAFLARFEKGSSAAAVSAAKNHGRDVVTAEDVEAAKRAGDKQILVSMGAIVTPLARQRAAEWGIEVNFQ